MSHGEATCPDCGPGATRKNRRDRQGRQIRFWGTSRRMWRELVAADVDLVIADDLPDLVGWFQRNGHA